MTAFFHRFVTPSTKLTSSMHPTSLLRMNYGLKLNSMQWCILRFQTMRLYSTRISNLLKRRSMKQIKRSYSKDADSTTSHPYEKHRYNADEIQDVPSTIGITNLLLSTPFLVAVVLPGVIAYYMSPDWRGAREPLGYWGDREIDHIDIDKIETAARISHKHGDISRKA